MSRSSTDTLLEREPELHRLREQVERAAGGAGGLVVIGGPAGIGKTELLRAAAAMAAQAGMRVLRGRGSDLEQEFAFGVVRQLFEAQLARAGAEERAALLSGAAALAGSLFDSASEPVAAPAMDADDAAPEPGPAPTGSARTDPARAGSARADLAAADWAPPADRRFTLVHSLYWLTSNLSATGSIALMVDDCHWSDAPSLRFLAYVSARCEELGALVVVTVREGEPSAARELLLALRGDLRATLIEPTSLSEDAVATLVRAALGEDADAAFCAACACASAGNPFLVRELIAELENERIEPVTANADRVESVRPESVSRAVRARLNHLGTDSRNLARSVAVLESASLRQAANLAGMPGSRARRAADRLISAQILAPSATLAFVHPVIQRAVYEGIPAAALADGHRRAGLLLAAEGARSTRVGAHLMRGAPAGDPAVVALLREAARAALTDGAPQTAVRLLRRALREPPGNEARGVVLGELGEAGALARDPAAAEHLREALDLVMAPAIRVRLARVLSELLLWDGRTIEAHSLLVRMLDDFGPSAAPPLRAVLETLRAMLASVDRRLVAEVEPRLPVLRELAAAAGPAGRSLLVFEASWRSRIDSHSADWRDVLEAGLDHGRLLAEEAIGSLIIRYATTALVLADEFRWAEQLLGDLRADTVSRGSIDAHLSGLTWGSLLALRRGELAEAESKARAALAFAGRHQVAWAQTWASAFLAEALLERAGPDEAERALALAPVDRMIDTGAGVAALRARGAVRLAQGRTEEAVSDLRTAGERVIVDNPNQGSWRSLLALALATGDPEQAREVVAEELELAHRFAQPRAIGVALRVRGLLEGGEEGITLLAESVQWLRRSPARLELARALHELGAAMRRAGRRSAARDPLREALVLAQRCGADLLAARIGEELAASGLHPRRERATGPAALTPAERRVAELAASGLTNREIAQTLYVTVKTVGTHLGHIYEKLDLQGPEARARLPAVLGTGNGTVVPEATDLDLDLAPVLGAARELDGTQRAP